MRRSCESATLKRGAAYEFATPKERLLNMQHTKASHETLHFCVLQVERLI